MFSRSTRPCSAALAGAAYVSPFVGRLDDIGQDGMQLVEDIAGRLSKLRVRDRGHRRQHPPSRCTASSAALAGAHIATVPRKVLMQMMQHPLTDAGISRFLADWKKRVPGNRYNELRNR